MIELENMVTQIDELFQMMEKFLQMEEDGQYEIHSLSKNGKDNRRDEVISSYNTVKVEADSGDVHHVREVCVTLSCTDIRCLILHTSISISMQQNDFKKRKNFHQYRNCFIQ